MTTISAKVFSDIERAGDGRLGVIHVAIYGDHEAREYQTCEFSPMGGVKIISLGGRHRPAQIKLPRKMSLALWLAARRARR